MSVGEFVGRVVGLLESAGVSYMLAGSVASSVHGAVRATQDVDVVVEVTRPQLLRLLAAMSPDDWYFDEEAALDAVRRRGMFNVVDLESGWKADFIVRKRTDFAESEFARRQRVDVFGTPTWVASAEDTIVAKLEWSVRSGGSERQRADVRGILQMRGADLDRAYIERLAMNADALDRSTRQISEESNDSSPF